MCLGKQVAIAVIAPLFIMAGCATTPSVPTGGGGSQMKNTVYATHQVVRKLDSKLDSSISKLNKTTVGLDARMADTDVQTRRLLSTSEENQLKLELLQRRLDELATVIYKHFGVSPPSQLYDTQNIHMPDTTVSSIIESPGTIVVTPPPEKSTDSSLQSGRSSAKPVPSIDTSSIGGGGATTDYTKAREPYDQGDYATALTQLTLYLEKYPESQYSSFAQFWKAQCYIKMKKYAEAIQEFDVLRQEYPKSPKIPTAMCNQAVAYYNLGQTARSEALFKKLIQDYPMDAASEDAKNNLKKFKGN